MDCYHVEAWDILQNLLKVKKINNHVLHFSAEFSSELDFAGIKKAVGLLADAFPLIRCGYVESGRRRPVWVDKGHHPEDITLLIETDDSAESARKFLCQEIDLENGPQMKIGVIRSGNADTLCVIINHMLCDAAGFKDVLYTIGSIYTHLEKQEKVQVGSMIRNRSIGQILKKQSLSGRMKIYGSKNRLNPHGDQKFDFEGDLSNPFIAARKISREQFRLIKEYAKSHQASINDVMLTAFLRVLFHTFGCAAALPCAIDLRRFLPGRSAESVCNLISNISCDIGSDIGGSFEDTLSRVKREMNFQKTNPGSIKNIAILEKLFCVFPYPIAFGILKNYFSNPPIAFTNIGILDKKRLVFGSNEMTGAFMTGSIKYNPFFQVSLTTFDDEAVLCVNLYGTEHDRQKIDKFLNDFLLELDNGILRRLRPC